MRYIILILIFFFIGCNHKTKNTTEINNTKEFNISKEKKVNLKQNIKIINIEKISLKFTNNKLIYPNKKTILLFYKNNFYSKEQVRVLNKLNVKFYKTKNKFLEKYFNINYYPTIVVLDKNKTIKFENFTPYEILKTEGF